MIRALLFFILAAAAHAAELEVTAGDLPRLPPTEPDKAAATFQLRPGYRLELAACEPQVVDPVAMAFDESGALFVVEMRDYSERRAEKLSRIRRLEDRDGDGRFETSTVYLDGLAWATSVACWDGGVFVIASPDIIFAKDTNGDGIADERRIVFTGFGEGRANLNVQALPNSLTWGPNCRIHGATAGNGGRIRRVIDGQPTGEPIDVDGADFSFDPRTLDFRAESGTAQFGLTFDEFGRKFVCSNSHHIQWVLYERHFAELATRIPLPPPLVDIAVDGPAAEVFRISPDERWRVMRTNWRASGLVPGLIEGGGRASGYFTSACGLHVSKCAVCPGDVFIADVGSNLVHRKILRETDDGPVAERAPDEQKSEFLASKDNWFRPISFADGPDGGLYIADMYREVVEHPDSLPPQIKQHLDLNSGNDRGRIWRVVPEKWERKLHDNLGKKSDDQLCDLLAHTNGWHSETALRLLLARPGAPCPQAFKRGDPPAVLALRAYRGQLTAAEISAALEFPRTDVCVRAIELAEVCASQMPRDIDPFRKPWVGTWFTSGLWNRTRPTVFHWPIPFDTNLFLHRYIGWNQPRNRLLHFDWGEWWDWNSLTLRKDLAWEIPFGTRRIEMSPAMDEEEPDFFGGGPPRLLYVRLAEWMMAKIPLDDPRLRWRLAVSLGGLETAGRDSWIAGLLAAGSADAEGIDPVRVALSAIHSDDEARRIFHLASPIDSLDQMNLALALRLPLESQHPLCQTALGWLNSATASEARKLTSIEIVATTMPGGASEVVSRIALDDHQPLAVRLKALRKLRTLDPKWWSNWADVPAALRTEILDMAAARPESARGLLDAVESKKLSGSELTPAQAARLRAHPDAAIRARAVALLGTPSADRRAVVEANFGALKLAGDATRGRAIFLVRCATCHRDGADGSLVGPERTSFQNQGKPTLLVAILDPNREVAPQFFTTTVMTKDGETLAGVLAREDAAAVTVRLPGGREATVPRSQVDKLERQSRSLMPEGVETGLDQQGLADLLEFLVK